MPTPLDFRRAAYDPTRVDASGKFIGRQVYWRLYSIENFARILIHTVLSVQLGAGWWTTAVDPSIQQRVSRFRQDYAGKPWHSTPGRHDLYYAGLADLSKILLSNSHLFTPLVPDIDQWVARIEQIRLPRNISSHMNWLDANDRKRIDVFHADFQALLAVLPSKGLQVNIPT